MKSHGIIEDIHEIGRFNYVLLSRSVEFDQFDETKLSSFCNQNTFIGNFKQGTLVSPGNKQSKEASEKTMSEQKPYMLPYQRRIKSMSPPRLEICNENYIVYS